MLSPVKQANACASFGDELAKHGVMMIMRGMEAVRNQKMKMNTSPKQCSDLLKCTLHSKTGKSFHKGECDENILNNEKASNYQLKLFLENK
jgi:hypothetical protein